MSAQRLMIIEETLISHLETSQQKYPPRQIRSLRMMRVRDAREGVNGVSDREAILTVWDVKDYATDFFREGKRYQVSLLLSFLSVVFLQADVRLLARRSRTLSQKVVGNASTSRLRFIRGKNRNGRE